MGTLYQHDRALFPALVVEKVRDPKASTILELAIKVEDLEHLQKMRGYSEPIRETKESSLRKISLTASKKGYTLTFVERKGCPYGETRPRKETVQHLEEIQFLFGRYRDTHIRVLKDPEDAYQKTMETVMKAIALVGRERAAYEWVQAEVNYWERRNKAAAVQGKLQRAFGLGWCNKDHLTYRNSKRYFPKTVEILSRLGFVKREKLYAEEFTAQVLEHPVLGLGAFIDVDPEEEKGLGTVGLWVEVHGESMLAAGLHHLAARYDFLKVREVLESHGIRFRPPFSDFDDLKQVFTEGERRVISESHGRHLLQERFITESQFRQYMTEGAVYTHLENIQRRNGFKGFQPEAVDKTLRDTGRSLRLKGKF